ncbi:MAG: PPC domain-containing protein [Planctomycetes bacterium]|nr:PPC domain-containing protein [Planctomycetota bacterium]
MANHTRALFATGLLASALAAQGTPEIEPNDAPATATALAIGAQADGAIGTAGDVDYWKITLTTTSDVRFWINPGRGTSIDNSELALLSADGTTQVAFNDDSLTPVSWLSTIVAGAVPAGTYYLRVASSQQFAPNGTGSYTLDVVAAGPGTYLVTGGGAGVGTPVAEATENNDPRQPAGVATPSFENSLNTGSIATGTPGTSFTDPAADYDFFELHVTRPGLLTVQTLTTAAYPAMRNSVLYLAKVGGSPFAMDDDSGFGRFSKLEIYVVPDVYHVIVKGYDPGNYVLECRLTPAATPGSATTIVRSGGCGPQLGVRLTAAGPVAAPELPILGSTFYVEGTNMPANAMTIHAIGTESLLIRFDLGPFGAPGCLVEVDPIDQSFATADANGVDHWGLVLPFRLAFLGLDIQQQIAVIDMNANALGVTVSNRVSSICAVQP